jgi:hypothetical protein
MMKLKSISTEGSCQNPIAVGAATAIVAGVFYGILEPLWFVEFSQKFV